LTIFLETLGTSPLSRAVAQMRKLESHYRQKNGFYLIEIRLNKIDQIFTSLDPSPFIEREIDRNAKTYIVESLQERPLNSIDRNQRIFRKLSKVPIQIEPLDQPTTI
jgi:hypothetical protein